jgi:hypothetical protein
MRHAGQQTNISSVDSRNIRSRVLNNPPGQRRYVQHLAAGAAMCLLGTTMSAYCFYTLVKSGRDTSVNSFTLGFLGVFLFITGTSLRHRTQLALSRVRHYRAIRYGLARYFDPAGRRTAGKSGRYRRLLAIGFVIYYCGFGSLFCGILDIWLLSTRDDNPWWTPVLLVVFLTVGVGELRRWKHLLRGVR